MKPIRPIADLGTRVQEAGRIRMGVKDAKRGFPKSLDTWRFTSPNKDCIEQIAKAYGGDPKPWVEPKASVKSQWEVITKTKVVDVLIPPGGLSQFYELWQGSGCVRRCDGVNVELVGRDGNPVTQPCLCDAEQEMQCKPYTRLSVVLPSITFRGVWRLETKSWNAADELPAMERMIDNLQAEQDIIQAQLILEQRSRVTGQGKRNFVVPVLTLMNTVEELAAGQAGLALNPAQDPTLALSAGERLDEQSQTPHQVSSHDVIDPDDAVVDAELVDDGDSIATDARRIANLELLDPDRFVTGLTLGVSKGAHSYPDQLSDDQLVAAREFLDNLAAGLIAVTGINDEGRLLVKKKE